MKKVSMRPLKSQKRHSQRQGERGQSLTVALIVLFLLLFLAGLFIVLVVNNLKDSRASGQRSQSNKYAQAGLNYLDEQLLKSAQGADWRPRPDCDYNDVPCNTNNIYGDNPRRPVITENDPDYYWLQPIVVNTTTNLPKTDDKGVVIGGFTRVPFDGGRALVRISYRPHYVATSATDNTMEPTSKYIKLESIGRVGTIDTQDPTTYGRSEAKGLRNELYAYKQVGLTDYLWQVTNKDGKMSSSGLGVVRPATNAPINPDGSRPQPAGGDVDANGVITNMALRPQAQDIESIFYGPVRINAGLDFYGKSRFFLDSRRNDVIEVAGQINLKNGATSSILDNATALGGNIQPSSGAFSTFKGLVRDNPQGTDTRGLTDASSTTGNANLRAVSTTAAPVIDSLVGSGDLTRYRLLTRNASPLPEASLQGDAAGAKGWGTGLYIPNRDDVQQASLTLGGAYSVRADWLNPNPDRLGARSYWQTPSRYIPPAVEIELFPRYMKITRYDKATTNYLWNAAGVPIAETTIVRYTPTPLANPTVGAITPLQGYPAALVNGTTNLYRGDYTIFAEGNIRIKGVVGGVDSDASNAIAYFVRHLTVVSNGTIYLDGNVLRDNIASGATDPYKIRGESSIALLAKDYVCVNTTQFLSPTGGTPTKEDIGSAVPEAYVLERDSSGSTRKQMDFHFAAAPVDSFLPNGSALATDALGNPILLPPAYFGSQFLMLRHSSTGNPLNASDQGPAPINVLLNNADFFGGMPPVITTSLIANPRGSVDSMGNPIRSQSGEYQNVVASFVPTPPAVPAPLVNSLGAPNNLTVVYDQDSGVPEAKNYRNSRLGIVPLDIRIEALMYAQEGSFFIIPGPWFNPDPNDTYERFIVQGNRRAGDSDLVSPGESRISPAYPFYGEPQDIRLTVFGGVSQNVSAEVGDQTEWMMKWGWVPNHFGSTGFNNAAVPGAPLVPAVITAHGRQGSLAGPLGILSPRPAGGLAATGNSTGSGLLYIFDSRMIAPYSQTGPLRPSPWNPTEPLPIAPNLPVAPGLLYKGENTVR